MAISEDRAYTQCTVEFHMQKRFVIALPKPADQRLDQLKERYGFGRISFDADRDLIARDGRISDSSGELVLRELGFLTTTEQASVVCLGDTTERAIAILEDVIGTAFDIRPEVFRHGVEYVTYETATKVQFGGPLREVFSPEFQSIIDKWSDVDTKSVVAPFDEHQWPPSAPSMVHTTMGYWEKYFGTGAPKEALVIPTDLDFFVYLPSRFFKMTKYRFRLTVESVEDFLEHRYFVKSQMPHFAHMEALNSIDAIVSKKAPPAIASKP